MSDRTTTYDIQAVKKGSVYRLDQVSKLSQNGAKMGKYHKMQTNAQSLIPVTVRHSSLHRRGALSAARRRYAELVQSEARGGFKSVVKELISLRNTDALDDDAFAEILESFLASYIELEVNAKLDSLLSSQLSSIRLVK